MSYSLSGFILIMASTAKALNDVDVVRGATNFVALQRIVLALITSLPREGSLLMSLTKVASVPPSVLTVAGFRASSVVGSFRSGGRVSRSVAPGVLRRTLSTLYAESALICFSCCLQTDIMLLRPSCFIILKFTVDFKSPLVPQVFELTLRKVFETHEKRL